MLDRPSVKLKIKILKGATYIQLFLREKACCC